MVNFQGRAAHIGRTFQEMCQWSLDGLGFDLRTSVDLRDIGIEVDMLADNAQGISFFVECKGSMHGERPGLIRTDTMKKALCNGFLLRELGVGPYVIMTSHLPTMHSAAGKMLMAAGRVVVFDVIRPLVRSDMKRLETFLTMDTEELESWRDDHPQFDLPE